MNNVSSLEVSDNELRIFADNGEAIYDIGEYSTKAKAIKVLDMIQEAYMDYKSGEIIGSGLAGSAYTGSYDTKESVAHGIAVLKGYGNEVRKSILFQMPENNEVVV
ncbi:MAG: hypothetical protein ACLT4U_07850 [Blautia obeum]|jgi:uncharacterized protein YegP (UPF0339 family)